MANSAIISKDVLQINARVNTITLEDLKYDADPIEIKVTTVEVKESSRKRKYVSITAEDTEGKEFSFFSNLLHAVVITKEQADTLALTDSSYKTDYNINLYDFSVIEAMGASYSQLHNIVVADGNDSNTHTVSFEGNDRFKLVGAFTYGPRKNEDGSYAEDHPMVRLSNYADYNKLVNQRKAVKDDSYVTFEDLRLFNDGEAPKLKPAIEAKINKPNTWNYTFILMPI